MADIITSNPNLQSEKGYEYLLIYEIAVFSSHGILIYS